MVKKHKKNPKKSTLNVSLSYLEKESIINAIRENDEEAIKKICSQFPKATLNGIKYQITASSENCSKELSLHPLQAAILLEKISLIPHLAAITDPEYFNRKLKSHNGSLTLIQLACDRIKNNQDLETVIKILFEYGADPNTIIAANVGENQMSLVCYAALVGAKNLAKIIIQHPTFNKDLIFNCHPLPLPVNAACCLTQLAVDNNNIAEKCKNDINRLKNQTSEKAKELLIQKELERKKATNIALSAMFTLKFMSETFPDVFSPIHNNTLSPQIIAIEMQSLNMLKWLEKCDANFNATLTLQKNPFSHEPNGEISYLSIAILAEKNENVIKFITSYLQKESVPTDALQLHRQKIFFQDRAGSGYYEGTYLMLLANKGYRPTVMDLLKDFNIDPFLTVNSYYLKKKNLTKVIDRYSFNSIKSGVMKNNEMIENIKTVNLPISAYKLLINGGVLDHIKHFFSYMKDYNKKNNDNNPMIWQNMLQECFFALILDEEKYILNNKNKNINDFNKNLESILSYLIEEGLNFDIIGNDTFLTKIKFDPLAMMIKKNWPIFLIEKALCEHVYRERNLHSFTDGLHEATKYDSLYYLNWLIDNFPNTKNIADIFSVESTLIYLTQKPSKNSLEKFDIILNKWCESNSIKDLTLLFYHMVFSKVDTELFIRNIHQKNYQFELQDIEALLFLKNERILKDFFDKDVFKTPYYYLGNIKLPLLFAGLIDESGKIMQILINLKVDFDDLSQNGLYDSGISLWKGALIINNPSTLIPMLKTKTKNSDIINLVEQGFSPLFSAVVAKDTALVNFLLQQHSSLLKEEKVRNNPYKKNALEQAKSYGETNEIYKIILTHSIGSSKNEHEKNIILENLFFRRTIDYKNIQFLKDQFPASISATKNCINRNKKSILATKDNIVLQYYYIETINLLIELLSKTNTTTINAIVLRPTLNILLHHYHEMDAASYDKLGNIILPLIDSVIQKQVINTKVINNQLKAFCQDKKGNDAADDLKNLWNNFYKFHDLMASVDDSNIASFIIEENLSIKIKMICVNIGDWVQKNKNILTSPDLTFEKDFFEGCKILRDCTSHENFKTESILSIVSPFYVFSLASFGKHIDLSNCYDEKQHCFEAILNERLINKQQAQGSLSLSSS